MSDAIEIPLIKATNENLKGYGYLIDSYENSDIEIVTWPNKDGVKLTKALEMKVVLLKDPLILGGKVVLYGDKIMQFNTIIVITK